MDEYQVSVLDEKPLGRELRAVGQAIEALGLRDFQVLVDGDSYLIKGQAPTSSEGTVTSYPGATGGTPPHSVELLCTPEIIRRIEIAGKAQRSSSNIKPDPLSPSQILRVIGNSLDSRQAMPTRIERRGETIIIDSVSESGARQTEERFVSSFYGISVRMQLGRAERSA